MSDEIPQYGVTQMLTGFVFVVTRNKKSYDGQFTISSLQYRGIRKNRGKVTKGDSGKNY